MSIPLPAHPGASNEALQVPPCGVYDLTNGAGVRVFRILSLGGQPLQSKPARTWSLWNEHWFSPNGQNLSAALASGPLTLKLLHRTDGPIDPEIQRLADELAVTSNFTFQIFSKGLLSQSDWVSGVPQLSTPNYYFVEQAAPIPTRAARPLFELQPSDTKRLKRIVWFTLDKTVAGYLVGVPDGSSITLGATATGSVPPNGWYFKAP